jgi:hypothetical protein
MRQWELFGITDTVSTWTPPPKPEPPLDPAAGTGSAIAVDRFPSTLWTTDASLRFTSAPGTAKVGLRPGSVDVLMAFGPDESDVLEAHVHALGGAASSFELDRNDVRFRCWVSPVRASDGQVCGTMCVGLELDAAVRIDPTVEYA